MWGGKKNNAPFSHTWALQLRAHLGWGEATLGTDGMELLELCQAGNTPGSSFMESWLLPARDGPSAPPGPGGTQRSGLVRGQRLDSVVLEVLLQAQGSWEAVGHWDAPGAGMFWGQAGRERRRGIFFFVADDFLKKKKIFVKQTRTPLNT